MFYPIINFQHNDIDGFVKQWSSFYNYDKMNLYNNNIEKETLTQENLIELYVWKNGSNLSQKKMQSLEAKILSKLNRINELKKKFSIVAFLKEFKDVSFVWKIFLLHIVCPVWYPIYDQHVHRAYLFLMKDNAYKTIENTIPETEKDYFYFEHYLHFITELRVDKNLKIQDIDKAFFSFGQFLKKYKVQLENKNS